MRELMASIFSVKHRLDLKTKRDGMGLGVWGEIVEVWNCHSGEQRKEATINTFLKLVFYSWVVNIYPSGENVSCSNKLGNEGGFKKVKENSLLQDFTNKAFNMLIYY